MKTKIKVGDLVKIINPEFFVRCGYPLCLDDVREKMVEEHGREVDNFIDKIVGQEKIDRLLMVEGRKNTEVYDRIITALSRYYIAQNNFGGKERKIYTVTIPDLKDKIYRVAEKSCKVTGTYVQGSGWHYTPYGDGEQDYEPSYLKNSKRRSLLHLNPCSVDNWISIDVFNIIEDIHVEKA